MEERITLERLGELLDRCLTEGISVKFIQPSTETPRDWKEIFEMTLNAYLTALRDVRDTLRGDPSAFEEFLSYEGRLVDFSGSSAGMGSSGNGDEPA
jgi:hypothetical protein